MELDHVAERVEHEDLLRLRTHRAERYPVLDSHALQLRPRLLDVGHREGDVRTRGVRVKSSRACASS